MRTQLRGGRRRCTLCHALRNPHVFFPANTLKRLANRRVTDADGLRLAQCDSVAVYCCTGPNNFPPLFARVRGSLPPNLLEWKKYSTPMMCQSFATQLFVTVWMRSCAPVSARAQQRTPLRVARFSGSGACPFLSRHAHTLSYTK